MYIILCQRALRDYFRGLNVVVSLGSDTYENGGRLLLRYIPSYVEFLYSRQQRHVRRYIAYYH
jgi:hypothetical protein